jgi:hypothetical protein
MIVGSIVNVYNIYENNLSKCVYLVERYTPTILKTVIFKAKLFLIWFSMSTGGTILG